MTPQQQAIIAGTAEFVRDKLSGESTGHDWWHVLRVWNNAKLIAKHEQVDVFIVELAALLHDIADWKFHDGDLHAGGRAARKWLATLHVDETEIDHVCNIIDNVSFKGAGVPLVQLSKEGHVVQDADRLDAIGAIGVARAFAYGGFVGHELYNPEKQPQKHDSFAAYKNNSGSTINHFYEKLLLLTDRMHTETAKKLARERHEYMEAFLAEFYAEWEGKR